MLHYILRACMHMPYALMCVNIRSVGLRHIGAPFLWYISTYLLGDIIASSTWNNLLDGCWEISAILHRDFLTDFILHLPQELFKLLHLAFATGPLDVILEFAV